MTTTKQKFITLHLHLSKEESDNLVFLSDHFQKTDMEWWFKQPLQKIARQIRRKTNGK